MRRTTSVAALAVALAALVAVPTAMARNYPCSGKKGGVDYCRSGKFVCKDGSTSASKEICSTR